MPGILIIVLKILGIVLLAVIAILLLALCLILFVPVRYRLDARKEEMPAACGAVTWLFGFVSLRAEYEKALYIHLRIALKTLFRETLFGGDEEADEGADEDKADMEAPAIGESPRESAADEKVADELRSAEAAERIPNREKPVIKKEAAAESETEIRNGAPEKKEPESGAGEKAAGIREDRTDDREEKTPKTGLFEKLRKKWKSAGKTAESVRVFLEDEENQKTFALLFRQIKKLLLHLLPRKVTGRIRFGFEDPYRTGQILTAVSPFYALYAKSLSLEPCFEEKILAGELHIRGRVRAATILWIGIRVFLNKNFRKLLKRFKG